jgi:DNA-binding LytR/AlgR family response regulator
MNIVIIEDEPLTAKDLEASIRAAEPAARIVAVLGSVAEAVEFFRENTLPDLIFSDIQLGDGLSFSIFAGFEQSVPVIFCTAYDAYALDAFKAAGIDYILKPFSAKSIAGALAKYQRLTGRAGPTGGGRGTTGGTASGAAGAIGAEMVALMELSALFGAAAGRRSILVYQKEKIVPVNVSDIAFFYLKADAVLLVTFGKQQYMVHKTLEELEKIAGAGFYRVNRQCLVNREAIRDVSQDAGRRLVVNLRVPFDEKVTVGRARVSHFLEWLAGA